MWYTVILLRWLYSMFNVMVYKGFQTQPEHLSLNCSFSDWMQWNEWIICTSSVVMTYSPSILRLQVQASAALAEPLILSMCCSAVCLVSWKEMNPRKLFGCHSACFFLYTEQFKHSAPLGEFLTPYLICTAFHQQKNQNKLHNTS